MLNLEKETRNNISQGIAASIANYNRGTCEFTPVPDGSGQHTFCRRTLIGNCLQSTMGQDLLIRLTCMLLEWNIVNNVWMLVAASNTSLSDEARKKTK